MFLIRLPVLYLIFRIHRAAVMPSIHHQVVRPRVATPVGHGRAAVALTETAFPLGGPGDVLGLASRRHLRVTHTPPQMPPMPPMDLRYNYAAGLFVVALFTWAALSPDDDGFNTLLGTGYDEDDDGSDDDDDVRYDGTGYEGRDKAMAGAGGRSSGASSGGGSGGGGVRGVDTAERD